MSTRAAIMRHEEGGGRGRYHHFDGYPTGLGERLWGLYHDVFGQDVDRMTKVLLDDHTGWSTIWGDWSLEPGYNEMLFGESGSILEGPDRPKCYCHGDRAEEGWEVICIDDPLRPGYCLPEAGKCDPLFMEWEYLLSHEGIEVRASMRAKGETEITSPSGNYMQPNYVHRTVAKVGWMENPDWATIEKEAGKLHEAAYYKYSKETAQ